MSFSPYLNLINDPIPFKVIQEEHQLGGKVKLADGEGLGQKRGDLKDWDKNSG